MKTLNSSFTQLATRAIVIWMIVFICLFIGGAATLGQQQKVENVEESDSTYGKGGKKITTIYRGVFGPNGNEEVEEVVTIYDPNGVKRENNKTSRIKKTNKVSITITKLFDCQGRLTYSKQVQYDEITGEETYFSEERFVKGTQVYGYERSIDKNGKKVTEKYNPKTNKYEEVALETPPPSNEVGAPERDTNVCSAPSQPNEFVGMFNFIREDALPDRFNTYGVTFDYTRYIKQAAKKPTVGLTADFNADFRSINGADLSKVSVLGGATVRFFVQTVDVPVNGAKTKKHPTIFMHALAGVSHFKSTSGTFQSTDNSFTMKLGGGVDVNVNQHFFIRPFEIDYAPTWFGTTRQDNVQFSFGVGFRWGGRK